MATELPKKGAMFTPVKFDLPRFSLVARSLLLSLSLNGNNSSVPMEIERQLIAVLRGAFPFCRKSSSLLKTCRTGHRRPELHEHFSCSVDQIAENYVPSAAEELAA